MSSSGVFDEYDDARRKEKTRLAQRNYRKKKAEREHQDTSCQSSRPVQSLLDNETSAMGAPIYDVSRLTTQQGNSCGSTSRDEQAVGRNWQDLTFEDAIGAGSTWLDDLSTNLIPSDTSSSSSLNLASVTHTYNQGNLNGMTLLHIAAERGALSVLPTILRAGLPVDIRDQYGRTALHAAARSGQVHAVALLIEWGADVNLNNACGWSALQMAVAGDFKTTMLKLIENGADIYARVP